MDSELLVLTGFESATDAGHILVLGLERLPLGVREMSYEALVKYARDQGGLSVLAHPAAGRFRLNRREELKPDAVEVLNASYPSEYFI